MAGYGQKEIARISGMNQSTISRKIKKIKKMHILPYLNCSIYERDKKNGRKNK
jgi:DNA-binding MarR family transcriptional regulator